VNEQAALDMLRNDLMQVPEPAFKQDVLDILRQLPLAHQSQPPQQHNPVEMVCGPNLESVGRPGVPFQVCVCVGVCVGGCVKQRWSQLSVSRVHVYVHVLCKCARERARVMGI